MPLMTARQFSKGSMSTASEAGKNGFSLLFLKLLENLWENSSLYNQKRWKFEIKPAIEDPFLPLLSSSLLFLTDTFFVLL